ncbi:hypothetical protein AABB24_012778 [Solanum stoloniferum]|uniref:Big map kinase/bmk n=1 Tax=Solanum stoloniferum TaxID=62892 RepID=A0ABD2U839_9SOLN
MEFEFERQRVTKEDLRELIFREILEYHPQLRKDYLNGVERTNFLYPSAVDQFRKQFAHLEENRGNGVPVVPMDRKHVSLPKSTVVHSNPISSKDQPIAANMRDRQNGEESCSRNCRDSEGLASSLTRTLQAQPRNALAKPGKVVGPGLAYDSGNREKYDPKPQVRNAVCTPQTMSSVYSYDRSGVVKQERSVETERGMNSHSKPMAPCGMTAKLAPDVAINIDGNPFYMMRAGVTKPDCVDD